MHDWQVNTWRTCAQQVAIMAMPENEIPPAMRVDYYLCVKIKFYADIDKNKRILTVIAFAEDRRAEAYHICSARKAKFPIAAHAHRKVGNIAVVLLRFFE